MPLPVELLTPPLLLLAPLLLRLVPGRPLDERWSWRIDPPLALLVGVVAAATCWRLGLFHVRAGFSVADFPEHCTTTAAGIREQWDHWTRNRTVIVGLPAVLAGRRVGIIDGLVAGSVVGTVLTGAGLYLWGRALHGRLAGVAAALLLGTAAPLAMMPRTLSFYPMIAGLLVLASALTAVAVRWRGSAAALALGGAGVGLALLTDVRGFIWALALLPAVVGVALLAHPRRWPLRLAAVLLPLWLSFQLGPKVTTPDHTPLEVQSNFVRMLQERGDPVGARYGRWEPKSGFVWGRTPLSELPETVRTILWYRKVAASRTLLEPDEAQRVAEQVQPWWPVMGGAALLALVGLRRRPLLVLGALATVAPFFAAYQGAAGIQRAHLRFLTSAMPFLPLLLGLAVATIACGALPRRQPPPRGGPPPARRRVPWRLLAAAVLLELIALGAVPTWLSPIAPWRRTLLHEDGGLVRLWGETISGRPSPSSQPCTSQLSQDLDAGRPRWVWPTDSQGNNLPR